MGWTGIYKGYSLNNAEKKQMVIDELTGDTVDKTSHWYVDKMVQKGNTFYALHVLENNSTGEKEFHATTVLTSQDNGYFNTKVVDSYMDTDTPLSYVKKVTSNNEDIDAWIKAIKNVNKKKNFLNNSAVGTKLTVKWYDGEIINLTYGYGNGRKLWITDRDSYINKSMLARVEWI